MILTRRPPIDVVRYALRKLERIAINAGQHPVLIHDALEALDKIPTDRERKLEQALQEWREVDSLVDCPACAVLDAALAEEKWTCVGCGLVSQSADLTKHDCPAGPVATIRAASAEEKP